MNYKIEDNYLTIDLPERIESDNHSEIQNEIDAIISQNPDKSVKLNADKLLYISSAGLRILLTIQKRGILSSIINVDNDVYSIFDMTGFTNALSIERKLSNQTTFEHTLIGEDLYGHLYRIDDDTVLRIYSENVTHEDILNANEYAKSLIPTEVSNALVVDTINSESGEGNLFAVDYSVSIKEHLSEHPEDADEAIKNLVKELAVLHSTTTPSEHLLPKITDKIILSIDSAQTSFAEAEISRLKDLVRSLSRNNMVIFRSLNDATVIYANKKPLFVNLSVLAYGNPLFELAGIKRNLYEYNSFFGCSGAEMDNKWKAFISEYLDTTEDSTLKLYDTACTALAGLLSVFDRPRHLNNSKVSEYEANVREQILNKYDEVLDILQQIKVLQEGKDKDVAEALKIDIKERTATRLFKKKYLLKNIRMNMYPGEMILLVGGSGAGKTTFLNAVTGYEKANAIITKGNTNLYKDYESIKHRIAFAPQQDLLRDEDTVYNTLLNAAQMRLPVNTPEDVQIKEVQHMMDIFGLADLKNNHIRTLSGGQRKRASIAVEFISDPILFFLDEPDSGLDGVMARSLMDDLRKITGNSKIVIVISHAPDRVIDLFDKLIILAKSETDGAGHLAFYGSPKEAKEFFERDTIEQILRIVNRKSEGGEGRADEFIEKYENWR